MHQYNECTKHGEIHKVVGIVNNELKTRYEGQINIVKAFKEESKSRTRSMHIEKNM